MRGVNKEQQEAFWSKVYISNDKKACWPWTGARNTNGYGNVKINNKHLHSHRVAFELVNGNIPSRFMVCHTCDNPPCCNPSHLMLGTAKSNAADMLIKNRAKDPIFAARGEINGNSKLTPKKVMKIRDLYARGIANQYQLAEKFNVSQGNIGYIVRNKTWRHVA